MDSRLNTQPFTNSRTSNSSSGNPALEDIAATVHSLAQTYEGDCLGLLAVLRLLEQLHRDIRDGLFQQALPSNRQHLYQLLRSIEAEGGWPYIHRMKLQTLLEQMLVMETPHADRAQSFSPNGGNEPLDEDNFHDFDDLEK